MITRLAVGLGGLALLLPAIIYGGTLAVEIIVPIAMLICVDEYARMAFPSDNKAAFGWQALAVAAVYSTGVYVSPQVGMVTLGLAAMGSMAFVVFRAGESLDGAADRAARHLLGIAWISLLGFLCLLRREDAGLLWLFVVLTIPWAGDTGAYFSGRAFGRHKLAPRVSPKKTWEGFFGGVATSILGLFIVRAVSLHNGGPGLTVGECVGLGALLSGTSVVGDLSESLLKRAFGVKDSGWIMPGHGGLLDRIDSVLFVAPPLYLYVTLVH